MKISSINRFMTVNQPGLIDFDVMQNSGSGRHGITLKPKVSTGAESNKISEEIGSKFIQIRVETIMSKLRYGNKISPGELKFLKGNAPHSYHIAVRVLRERENFRKELRTCRTKQQVDRAYAMKISCCMTAMKASAMAGAHGGNADKNGEVEFLQMKCAALMHEYNRFKTSAEYKKLKDEGKEDKKILSLNRSVHSVSRRLPNPGVARFAGPFIFYA
ncbi:MAG: hypothetical protein GX887_05190 [Firmicutes bacterium]|nr:hypothetical protein [Bacillota bacterium]